MSVEDSENKINENVGAPHSEDIPVPDDTEFREMLAEPSSEEPPAPKKKRIRKQDAYRGVVEAMCQPKFLPEIWQPFPLRFENIEDEQGVTEYVVVDSYEVVRHIKAVKVKKAIRKYTEQQCPHLGGVFISKKDADEILDLWSSVHASLDPKTIRAFRQLSETGLTYHRLPWDLCEGQTPLLDEMMSRTSNGDALMDFIGSLFFDDADRQTYVWLYGTGGDGKGTLIRMLARVFAGSYSSETTRGHNNFWTSGLLGKRLVVFPECEDYAYPSSGEFKNLTGGEAVRCERKKQDVFSAQLIAMFMYLSNNKPELNLSPADMRRVIYCHMLPPKEYSYDGPVYEQMIWAEAKHWLWKCIDGYERRYPSHSAIRPHKSEIESIAAAKNDYFDFVFEKYFYLVPLVPGKDDKNQPFTLSTVVQEALANEKMDSKQKRTFAKYLEISKGLVCKQIKIDDRTPRVWLGMRDFKTVLPSG